MADAWDPEQYNRFAEERELPFWDLVALLQPERAPRIADLGCGDGRLTLALHEQLGARASLGLDSSAAMIAAAARRESPEVRFELGDIGQWCQPSSFDVVFANASLHWVPDHPTVLRRLVASLHPGGQLAVQVPANADDPAHQVASEVAADWLADPPPDPVADNVLLPEAYCRLLDEVGCVQQHVRLQVYAHRLPSTEAVVEWVRGTTLTRFKARLGADQWDGFLDQFRHRLLAVLGDHSPYLYPFKRILLWGRIA
jgi:trans-aconitate 2-methyltransferase